jgi:hypothetical protein
MLELVRRGRRRLLNAELMSQGANACSAALAAFILLLLLGTEILAWYWLLLIPLAAAGVGIYFALRRVPSPYRTAQLLDRRAALPDTLSTAFYFSTKSDSSTSDVVNWQNARAEEAAQGVDLRSALPYRMPRTAYAVAALALVATSLFALRYGLSRSLSLKPPLAAMLRDEFTPSNKTEVAENRQHKPPSQDPASDADGANKDQDQQGQDQQNDQADNPADQQGQQQADGKSGQQQQDQANKQNGDPNQDGQQGQQQQDGSQDQQDSGQQGSASQGENKGDPKQQSDGKQNSNSSNESGSLLSKMKDFAENLLSKMKPQPSNSNPPQQGANQNSKQSQGQQQNGKQQNSKDGQQNSSEQADAQQGQSGDQKDGQDSQGKGNGDKSQQANKQPGSGIGSEDGNKDIRRAEQLAAMGKITELVGKRSAQVTGEATVEVQNTNQQLHTAYVQRGAQHQQTGAQIDRDEVPLALQPYVEQYFEQVRKQPAAVTPTAAKK